MLFDLYVHYQQLKVKRRTVAVAVMHIGSSEGRTWTLRLCLPSPAVCSLPLDGIAAARANTTLGVCHCPATLT